MDTKLSVEWVSAGRLFCSPANPRRNDDAVPHVAASLRRFGWQQPIVARPSGEVVAGNTRFKAAQSLGLTELPVAWFDGSDLDAAAYKIADNRTHEFATWDDATLARILEQLRVEDALEGVGFSDADIDQLLADLAAGQPPQELADPGPGEPPEEPVSRLGDLWLPGDHRLLCGDSTMPDDVARLLAGERPLLMVTDPPYGVEYDPDWRNQAGVSQTARTGKVLNDDRADWTDAWRLFTGDVAYVWHAGRSCGQVAANLSQADFEIRAQIIWAKSRFALSRGNYHWQHEPCWYAVRRGATAHWVGDRTQSTIWEIGSTDDGQWTPHGTQKPLECMERPMRNHDAPSVYEPFSGSGTSLIAAGRLRRRCFAMELDPGYVDVALRRWEQATGKQAVLEATGETFAATQSERATP